MTVPLTARSYGDVDQFQADIQHVCGRFSISPVSRSRAFSGRIGLEHLGGLEVASIGLDADSVARSRRDIRTDDANYFFLVLQAKGKALMQQGGHRVLLREGHMFLVDSAAPASFQYKGRYAEQLSLHLPRDEIIHRFGDRVHGGIEVRREDALSLAMRSVLKRMRDQSLGADQRLAEAFLGVFGAFLYERRDGGRPQFGDDRSLLAAALKAIDLNACDSEFGPQQLADQLGVSMRKLQREFKRMEATPRQTLMSIRLARARQALRQRPAALAPQTVSEIAFDQGFNDLSYFYREFRKRYGVAPGEAADAPD